MGQGHGPDDAMWPWDGGASAPGTSFGNPSLPPSAALLPTEASIDRVTPEDVLDIEALGYLYDGEESAREFGVSTSGVTHQWATVTLGSDYGPKPAVVAAIQTFNDTDCAAVRFRNASGTQAEVRIEEEESADTEIEHLPEAVGYLVGEAGLIHDTSGRIVGELVTTRFGQVHREHWEPQGLRHGYGSPVVIAQIGSFHGTNPAHIRLQGVGSDAFDFQIEEWAYQNGVHYVEDVSFLAVEAGRHRLQDGAFMEAGTATVDHDWDSVSFGAPFGGDPVVLSHCMTRNGGDPVVTRHRNISPTGFDVRLQEEEAKAGEGHLEETVGYVALFR